MKMKHIIPTIMVLALVVAMAPSAQAICSPPKTFLSWSAAGYTYVYGHNPSAPTFGSFWQPGGRLDHNEGTYDVSNWLRFYSASYSYFAGNLGDGGVVGCPGGELIIAVTQDNEDGTASFLINRETEDPGAPTAFWPATSTFTPMPAPRATASSRAGETVIMDVSVADFAEGFFSRTGHLAEGSITGISLYTFHGAADPGRDAANWTFHSTIPYTGADSTAAGLIIGCVDDGMDTYVAAAINLTGELDTLHVGPSIVVECDGTLADPDDKFDMIRTRNKKLAPSSVRR